MAKKRKNPVTVKVKTDGAEMPKNLQLYLFTKDQKMIESVPIKNGEAKLQSSAEAIKGKTEILIGPPIPKEFKKRKLTPVLIQKMGGYNPPFD